MTAVGVTALFLPGPRDALLRIMPGDAAGAGAASHRPFQCAILVQRHPCRRRTGADNRQTDFLFPVVKAQRPADACRQRAPDVIPFADADFYVLPLLF